VQFRDEQQWAFRNPEKCELFIQSMLNSPTGLVTGTAATGSGSGGGNINLEIQNNPWSQAPDAGPSQQAESVFSGLYGADRNYNLKLDRGPVPPSVRLRAVTVARFNFYDPRIQCLLH
jgi:hypothetical protein